MITQQERRKTNRLIVKSDRLKSCLAAGCWFCTFGLNQNTCHEKTLPSFIFYRFIKPKYF